MKPLKPFIEKFIFKEFKLLKLLESIKRRVSLFLCPLRRQRFFFLQNRLYSSHTRETMNYYNSRESNKFSFQQKTSSTKDVY